jgi:hypothetical protein
VTFALSHQGVAHRHIAISWGFHHRSTPPATWFPPMSLTPSAPPPQTWPITCNQFYFHYSDLTYFEELLRKFDFKLQSILPSGAKPQYPTACTKESCVSCLASVVSITTPPPLALTSTISAVALTEILSSRKPQEMPEIPNVLPSHLYPSQVNPIRFQLESALNAE